MNIFVSSKDPIESAIWLDDKRVRHMPKETLEMLHMAIYKRIGEIVGPFIIWGQEYRDRYELFHNPCTNWVANNRANMNWTWRHGIALIDEYQYRFGERHWLKDAFFEIAHYIPSSIREPKSFRNSSGIDKHKDITLNYQECLSIKWLITDEIKPVIWTNREEPYWLDKFRQEQGTLNFNNTDYEYDIPF